MTEDRMRELFRQMREEPLPAESLARVRLAVARRTRRQAAFWWKLGALLGAAACVVLVMFWGWPSAHNPKRVEPIVAHQPNPVNLPATTVRHEPRRQVVLPRPKRTPQPAQAVERAPGAPQDILIRIETPDPDVVIFFVAEKSGE